MEIPSTHEGNKILANFMGYEYIPFNNPDGLKPGWWKKNASPKTRAIAYAHREKGGFGIYLGRHHTCLKYHIDWNILMSVYFKFRKMDVAYEITSKGIRIYDHMEFDGKWGVWSERDEETGEVHGNIIYDAWRAAIFYVQYYNNLNNKK